MAPGVFPPPVIKCLLWAARAFGYAVLGAVALVVFSPVLLLMLALLALLVAAGLGLLGFALGLAAIPAYILHSLCGLPFWFWMILTGTGAVLLCVGVLVSAWNECSGDRTGTGETCSRPAPLLWLLAALFAARCWGESTGE